MIKIATGGGVAEDRVARFRAVIQKPHALAGGNFVSFYLCVRVSFRKNLNLLT